ncbi:hypothetical protein EJ110_NYTH19463, partial [Nymphaea thermarum]
EALEVLQGAYQKLQSWAGDPCLPRGFTWDWLSCNMDDLPRVTELELSNNSLSGQIPDFLGTFPQLKELVTGNNITGGNPSPPPTNGNPSPPPTTANQSLPPTNGNSSSLPTNGKRNMKPIIVGVPVGLVPVQYLPKEVEFRDAARV